MKLWILFAFSLVTYLASYEPLAFGAACCGGGFAIPSLITGDDKAQLTASYSFNQVAVDNVDANGVWRRWEEHQQIQTLQLEGAHIVEDRWQMGLSVPVVQRSYLDDNHSGLGDVTASVGYEFLPDWDYNPFRPKGIGYIKLVAPSERSRAESNIGGLDSFGNGFWGVGTGAILSKSFFDYDVFSSLEIHHSFAKRNLNPGFGGNFSLGVGYNFTDLRIGGSMVWIYEDPIDVTGLFPSKGSSERSTTATLTANYLWSDGWASLISYSDQTLFGNPVNTSLGKVIAVGFQKRWSR